MRLIVSARHDSKRVVGFSLILLACVTGCEKEIDTPQLTTGNVSRTPSEAARNADALATLLDHWDSETITGAMVDEIKKVFDNGEPKDIEPLLKRLELLETSGDVYAEDFALWWDKRGRNELGGPLFWRRDLLHQAIEIALDGRNDREMMPLLREAADTGDPVARMWLALADEELTGRHDASALGNVVALIEETRELVEAGDSDAAYFLGLFAMEADMDLVGGSPEEVLGWLEMAADDGNNHAAVLLAEAYSRGRRGFPRDPEKAALWAAKASEGNATESEPLSRSESMKRASQNNLKQLGLVMKMFANESRGEVFPPLTTLRGQLAMDASKIFPEYVADVNVYISPAHPDYNQIRNIAQTEGAASVIGDHSYWYLGYTLPDEATGLAFVNSFRAAAKAGETLTEDIEAPELEQNRIFRLREGIERFMITDINNPSSSAIMQSQLPVLIERPGFFEGGTNVLFMDGHVEFMPYPGKFPMTENFIKALESLNDVRETL
jgi:prepilin-type processing-associated H-X9-DG protein